MRKATQARIINAYFSLAENKKDQAHTITIAQIAEEAHLTRQIILRDYYQNTSQLLDDVHSQIDDEILERLKEHAPQPGISPIELFAVVGLPVIYHWHHQLRVIYTTTVDPTWHLFIEQRYKYWIAPYLSQAAIRLGVKEEFLLKVIVECTMGVISAWVTESFPEPVDSFRKTFTLIMSQSMNSLIDQEYSLVNYH